MNLDLALKVVTVSASGALAPGPLTAATAALGARKGWKAGVGVAVGHTIVEFPLVLSIAYGLGGLLDSPASRLLLGVAGGAFMLFFGYLTLTSSLKPNFDPKESNRMRGPLATGVALSLFNPFFIVWWLGVGSPLVAEALQGGQAGILAFYLTHVWLDYAWLTIVAAAGSLSRMDTKAYRVILAALALLVLYFGASMLAEVALQALGAYG
ncbi:MAG: LysE family transporter [Thermofilaceae archaeon]